MRPDAVIDFQDAKAAVIRHDARTLPFDDGTVDLIVTSPPYFALRSYQDSGEHYDEQIGSEDTPQEFVDALTECMVEWRRVLKPSGSVWINLGDKYSQRVQVRRSSHQPGMFPGKFEEFEETWAERAKSGAVRMPKDNIMRGGFAVREKSLMGLPWRFAIAQIDAGWILRAEVVWSKPNGLPESVTDRVRRSHEQWFHFVKEPRYFSAADEIREPHNTTAWIGRDKGNSERNPDRNDAGGIANTANPLGRLPSSVWTIPTEPLIVPDAVKESLNLPDHFAAFPQEWPRRIILGWSPEKGIVLDPFGGTGTVAGVARTLGRYGISNDLSADYNRLAIWRIWESGHFTKTEQRSWADRQQTMI